MGKRYSLSLMLTEFNIEMKHTGHQESNNTCMVHALTSSLPAVKKYCNWRRLKPAFIIFGRTLKEIREIYYWMFYFFFFFLICTFVLTWRGKTCAHTNNQNINWGLWKECQNLVKPIWTKFERNIWISQKPKRHCPIINIFLMSPKKFFI